MKRPRIRRGGPSRGARPLGTWDLTDRKRAGALEEMERGMLEH